MLGVSLILFRSWSSSKKPEPFSTKNFMLSSAVFCGCNDNSSASSKNQSSANQTEATEVTDTTVKTTGEKIVN